MTNVIDHEMLEMAIVGYEKRREELHKQADEIYKQAGEIAKRITELSRQLIPKKTESIHAVPKKHISAAGKAAIAKAQRARWVAYNKAKAKKAQKAA